jgi:hypothetical protein
VQALIVVTVLPDATTIVALPDAVVVLAVIVVVPSPVAVKSPVADTVATAGAFDCQVTPDVTAAPRLVSAVS